MEFEDFGIFGFDVSFYQDVNATPQKIDFSKMYEYGASFAVIKAGQYTYADEDFADNWRNSKLAGIPRSAYWFCDKDDSGQAQARRFWNLVKNDQPEGMLFGDYEDGSWTTWNQLYNFLKELQNLSGYPSKRIGIYTGYYYWIDHDPLDVTARNWFKQFPLWLAAYYPSPTYVKVPTPWTECLLWQDGTPCIGYQVGAESREIDHNKFNGDPIKFKQYMGGVPVTPPTGGNVILYYADLKSGYTSNVRTGAGLGYPVKTSISGPLTVSIVSEKVTIDNYDWYQIESPTSGFIALTTAYTNVRSAGVAQPYPVQAIIVMSDGSQYKGPVTKQ
jgi:hypothetical protein